MCRPEHWPCVASIAHAPYRLTRLRPTPVPTPSRPVQLRPTQGPLPRVVLEPRGRPQADATELRCSPAPPRCAQGSSPPVAGLPAPRGAGCSRDVAVRQRREWRSGCGRAPATARWRSDAVGWRSASSRSVRVVGVLVVAIRTAAESTATSSRGPQPHPGPTRPSGQQGLSTRKPAPAERTAAPDRAAAPRTRRPRIENATVRTGRQCSQQT